MVQKSINYRWNESFFDRTALKSQPQILSGNQPSQKVQKLLKKKNLKWKILESIIVIVKTKVINYRDGNTRNVISWSLMSKLLSQV